MIASPHLRLDSRFKSTSGKSARAFTRVELLAVLAAGALLAVVALPLLGSDAIRTQRAVCANNLGRIGQALGSWVADHDERYPWDVPQSSGGTLGGSLSHR